MSGCTEPPARPDEFRDADARARTEPLPLPAGRARTAAGGEWITPEFNAGHFTASGNMKWIVDAGDVTTLAYTVAGKTLTLVFSLSNTSVGGIPSTELRIAIPGGFTSSKFTVMPYVENSSGAATTNRFGFGLTHAGGTYIALYRERNALWGPATNLTNVHGTMTFEVH